MSDYREDDPSPATEEAEPIEETLEHPDNTPDGSSADYGDEVGETTESEPELFYPNFYAYVEDWVATVYLRKNSQNVKWCPQWWKHPEAVVVLSAVWEAWELMRVSEPGSAAGFLVERFYPLMDRLTSANGTFHLCSPEHGHSEATRMQDPGVMPTYPAPPEFIAYISGIAHD